MDKIRIVTNNPLVKSEHPDCAELLDGGTEDVLIRVRDYMHKGAKLLTHPSSGGTMPGENPYKSLVVSGIGTGEPATADAMALALIEDAIRLTKKTPDGFIGYNEKTLEDFRVIDLDLLNSAMT